MTRVKRDREGEVSRVTDPTLQPLFLDAVASREKCTAHDIVPLTPDDFGSHFPLLQRWLASVHKIALFDLSMEEAKNYFLRFVIEYNTQKLPREYFRRDPTNTSEVPSPLSLPVSSFTSFRWEFTNNSDPHVIGLLEKANEAASIAAQWNDTPIDWQSLPRE